MGNFLATVPSEDILKIPALHLFWQNCSWWGTLGHVPDTPERSMRELVRDAEVRERATYHTLEKWQKAWSKMTEITKIAPLQSLHVTIWQHIYDIPGGDLLAALSQVRAASFIVNAATKYKEHNDSEPPRPFEVRYIEEMNMKYVTPGRNNRDGGSWKGWFGRR
jgi:hypothetical protein